MNATNLYGMELINLITEPSNAKWEMTRTDTDGSIIRFEIQSMDLRGNGRNLYGTVELKQLSNGFEGGLKWKTEY